MTTISTEQRICDWAAWSRSGGPVSGLGYKSPQLALMRQNMGGGVPLPPVSDDEAMLVDAAVSHLKEKRGDLWLALVLYYGVHDSGRCGGSYTAVGRFLGSHKHHAQQLVVGAVAWLDGYLDRPLPQAA